MTGHAEPRPHPTFRAQIRADRPYYLAIALYLLVSILLALLYDRDTGGPLLLVSRMLVSIVTITINMGVVWFGLQWWRAARSGRSLRQVLWYDADGGHLARFLMLPALFVFLSAFNTIKVLMPRLTRLNFDRTLSDLDRTLHGGEPWRILQGLLGEGCQNLIQVLYLRAGPTRSC